MVQSYYYFSSSVIANIPAMLTLYLLSERLNRRGFRAAMVATGRTEYLAVMSVRQPLAETRRLLFAALDSTSRISGHIVLFPDP